MTFHYNNVKSSDKGLEILDIRRDIFPTLRHKTVEIPGREGSILFPVPYGTRIIEVDCVLIGSTGADLLSLERTLAEWLSTDTMYPLYFGDNPEYFFYARVSNVCPVSQNGRFAFITITFECEPFALSVTPTVQTLTIISGQAGQISVPGTAHAIPQVRISPVSENVIGLTMTVDGKNFIYNGTIEAGKELLIDSKNMTAMKVNTGAMTGSNVLGLVSGTFPVLPPTNVVVKHVASNGASAKYTFTYRARWV